MKAKFLTAIVLIGSLLFTGCAQAAGTPVDTGNALTSGSSVSSSKSESIVIGTEPDQTSIGSESAKVTSPTAEAGNFQSTIDPSEFNGPSDVNFLQYVKDATYAEAIKKLDSDKYVVENVEVTYISPEYIAELEYNSKANIYFGHTEEDLAKQFDGEQVVFTMDDKGQTSVEKFVPNGKGLDPAYKKALIKTGIGVGVILVCVVVSIATEGAAPAVAAVFAFSAKSAAIGAAISGTTGGVLSGVVEGFRNKNFDRAAKAAAESAGDGIMWGSIFSAISGGISELRFLSKLSKATKISMNDIAIIQKESALPIEVIKNLNSMKEYNVLKDAKLKLTEMKVKGDTRPFLLRNDIDWNFIHPDTISPKNPNGLTNLQLALNGKAPYAPSGIKYQIHHVGQHNSNGVYAILTDAEHKAIPTFKGSGVEHGASWNAFREDFWKQIGKLVTNGVLT